MAITKVEVVINDTMKRTIQQLAAHHNKSVDEMLSELIERGAKDMVYRIKRNAQKWQEQKALNERIKELEQLVAANNE